MHHTIYFRRIISLSFFVAIIVATTGCMSNPKPSEMESLKRKDILTKPYELTITPIIGSRQDDTKVIMDMGKIMKIWIAPYKNGGTFVSSHDNYVVAKAPDFVVGEAVPQNNWKSMKTPTNKIPFLFRDADLDISKKLDKEEIVKYNNNIYKQQNNVKVAKKRLQKANLYDEEIKNFLNN